LYGGPCYYISVLRLRKRTRAGSVEVRASSQLTAQADSVHVDVVEGVVANVGGTLDISSESLRYNVVSSVDVSGGVLTAGLDAASVTLQHGAEVFASKASVSVDEAIDVHAAGAIAVAASAATIEASADMVRLERFSAV
jgi:hypothetical protein